MAWQAFYMDAYWLHLIISFRRFCSVSFGLQDNNVWRHIKGVWFERDWCEEELTDDQWERAKRWLTHQASQPIEPDYFEGMDPAWTPGQDEWLENIQGPHLEDYALERTTFVLHTSGGMRLGDQTVTKEQCVADLKEMLEAEFRIPRACMQLSYKGRMLIDAELFVPTPLEMEGGSTTTFDYYCDVVLHDMQIPVLLPTGNTITIPMAVVKTIGDLKEMVVLNTEFKNKQDFYFFVKGTTRQLSDEDVCGYYFEKTMELKIRGVGGTSKLKQPKKKTTKIDDKVKLENLLTRLDKRKDFDARTNHGMVVQAAQEIYNDLVKPNGADAIIRCIRGMSSEGVKAIYELAEAPYVGGKSDGKLESIALAVFAEITSLGDSSMHIQHLYHNLLSAFNTAFATRWHAPTALMDNSMQISFSKFKETVNQIYIDKAADERVDEQLAARLAEAASMQVG